MTTQNDAGWPRFIHDGSQHAHQPAGRNLYYQMLAPPYLFAYIKAVLAIGLKQA
ncbi:MAG: hypothetical protein WB992_02905 [Bryobacteraceae bacterium]